MATKHKYVTDNRKEYDKIMREFTNAGKIEVTVGLHEDLGVHPGPHNEKNLTYAQIGTIQEYGATVMHPDGKPIDIPSRPFTASTFDKNKSNIIADIVAMQKKLVAGKSALLNARIVGEKHEARQKAAMTAWTNPPNSARTVKLKGFNDPLVHTGAMIKGVNTKVNGK